MAATSYTTHQYASKQNCWLKLMTKSYLSVPKYFLRFEYVVFLTSNAPESINLLLYSEQVNSTFLLFKQFKICAFQNSMKVVGSGDICVKTKGRSH